MSQLSHETCPEVGPGIYPRFCALPKGHEEPCVFDGERVQAVSSPGAGDPEPEHDHGTHRDGPCPACEPEEYERACAAPVQPAGPDTVERVVSVVEEIVADKRDLFEDKTDREMAEAIVAAVGPVGRPVPTFRSDFACSEDMGSDPCGEPAVALRVDPSSGQPYPVCAAHDRPWSVGRSCEVTDEMAEAGSLPIVHDWEIPPVEALPMARAVLEAALRTTAPDGEG